MRRALTQSWARRMMRGLIAPGHRFLDTQVFHRRRHVMTLAICAGFLAVLARLALFAEADATRTWAKLTGDTPPAALPELRLTENDRDRAQILDASGMVLAGTVNVSVLCHAPGKVKDPAAAARALSTIIPEADPEVLEARMRGTNPWLSHEVSPRQQQEIHNLYIQGIEFCDDKKRIYPHGPLFAHLIGFTAVGNEGLSGMEKRLNLELQSSDEPLQTSLDATVQAVIAEELEEQIDKFEAIGGVAVLMRAGTGEIISLVSLPTFDPLNIKDVNDPALFNRATKGLYELGSIMKPFTIAAALNEGLINPSSQIDVTRNLTVGKHTIADFPGTPKGIFTVGQVIERSSNIGTARIADMLGSERQQAYLRQFGFTRPADIELAEISSPLLPSNWGRIQTMTIGYGHGISITPLQAVAAEAALVNGGLYRRPTLLARDDRQAEAVRVISEQTSAQVRAMLRRVAVFGSGRKAQADGYVIGGKTGTADKPKGGAYCEDCRIASFLGAFPVHDPEYVLLVSIDEPKPQEWTYGYATGGWVAAPAFSRIVQRVGPHLGIQRLAQDPYGFSQPKPITQATASAAPQTGSSVTATPAPSQASNSGGGDFIGDLINSDGTIF